jgi:hypothetical protein
MLVGVVVGILFSVVYQRTRRPGWAATADKIRVPYAGWIIAVIVVLTFGMLLFMALQDPLKPR